MEDLFGEYVADKLLTEDLLRVFVADKIITTEDLMGEYICSRKAVYKRSDRNIFGQ